MIRLPRALRFPGDGALDTAQASQLFRLINDRHERASVLITTNKAIREWPEVLAGDAVLASAILDRLLHRWVVLDIRGRSYRLRDLEQTFRERQETIARSFLLPEEPGPSRGWRNTARTAGLRRAIPVARGAMRGVTMGVPPASGGRCRSEDRRSYALQHTEGRQRRALRAPFVSFNSLWWNPGERRERRGARLTRRVREEYLVYFDRNATQNGAKRSGSAGMHRRSNAAWVPPQAVNPTGRTGQHRGRRPRNSRRSVSP